jgi:uncharacterized protein
MFVRHIISLACAAAFAGAMFAGASSAQTARPPAAPSAASVAAAKEILELKGGLRMFETIVLGVIEQHKELILQSNPMLSRDLNEITNKLRVELAPRRAELDADVIRIYARSFTEQELKDLLAFYKSPLGKKVIEQEPKILDDSMGRASEWADKLAQEVVQKIRVEMRKKGHNL